VEVSEYHLACRHPKYFGLFASFPEISETSDDLDAALRAANAYGKDSRSEKSLVLSES